MTSLSFILNDVVVLKCCLNICGEESKVKEALLKIKKNIASRKETDRIMWFSMWAVLSVASFGIAWFPMIYYTLKRRNDHFSRQEKLETLILQKLKNQNPEKSAFEFEKEVSEFSPKNATVWTISTLLIVPAFYLFYSLKNDLQSHEEYERAFIAEVNSLAKDSGIPLDIQSYSTTPSFPINKYAIISVVTLGVAAAYWLYRIFNDYNNHFKMQWIIEDKLFSFLKALDQKTS